LAAFCESLGTKLTSEELEAALLILDESGDGNISYEEFAEWWLDE
jgi:Ca2+-binding EF-hand superfamily protein